MGYYVHVSKSIVCALYIIQLYCAHSCAMQHSEEMEISGSLETMGVVRGEAVPR
jgi:hypothetical protein